MAATPDHEDGLFGEIVNVILNASASIGSEMGDLVRLCVQMMTKLFPKLSIDQMARYMEDFSLLVSTIYVVLLCVCKAFIVVHCTLYIDHDVQVSLE